MSRAWASWPRGRLATGQGRQRLDSCGVRRLGGRNDELVEEGRSTWQATGSRSCTRSDHRRQGSMPRPECPETARAGQSHVAGATVRPVGAVECLR